MRRKDALLVFICSVCGVGVSAFCSNLPSAKSKAVRHPVGFFGKETAGDDDVDGDTDEEEEQKPYGNRSLAWTKRYRKTIPYETARLRAMGLGLSSKQEWDEYIEEGSGEHGAYLLNRPDEMYRDDWVSWEEFLGAMRPYDETRRIVQNV